MRDIELSPGIRQPLCGWEWYTQHRADFPNGIPLVFEISRTGSKHTVTVKDERSMREVINTLVKE